MLEMIRKTLLDYVDVPAESITEETDFVRDLKMNSYDFISLLGQMEEIFGIEIPDEDIREFHTVGEVVEYLKQKI